MKLWQVVCVTLGFVVLVGIVVTLGIFMARRRRKQDANLPEGKTVSDVVLSNSENIQASCISLPYRREKFERVRAMMAKQNIQVQHFLGVIGRHLKPKDYGNPILSPMFRNHLIKTQKHLGHLGATFSHLGVWRDISDARTKDAWLVLEDDVIVDPDFRTQLADRLARVAQVDPDWDVLLLGFSCDYGSYDKCHMNDGIPRQLESIVKVEYFMGLWAYVVNGSSSADKILDSVFPNNWCIDHHLCGLVKNKKINLYGSIPTIGFHPGSVGISSWNYTAVKAYGQYFSDTNN